MSWIDIIPIFALPVVTVATIIDLVLAYIVYRSNPQSATSKIFGTLGISTALWIGSMYAATGTLIVHYGLWLSRLTLVLATPMNLAFFLLAATIPGPKLGLSRKFRWVLYILSAAVILVAVSPWAFSDATIVDGRLETVAGPGLAIFGIFSIFLNLGAAILLFLKFHRSRDVERRQMRLVMVGFILMFALIIGTIFIPVLLAQNTVFVVFAPFYILLFLGSTAYAIVRHRLFDLKVIATEAVTAILWIVLFSKIVSASSFNEKLLDSLILVVVVIFGILLARSVRQEVAQREQLEALTKQLEMANGRLESLSRFKSQILSLASHQIKSPLAIIKGYLTVLLDGLYGPVDGKVKATLEKIKQSADGLTSLIDDLLNLRRVEEGRMDYKFSPINIGSLVEGIVESFRVLAYQKGLVLDYKDELPAPVLVEADPEKIGEVFRNLIDNSLKYTPQGYIRVSVAGREGRVLINIQDSGLGMSAELLPRLFGEFVRDERIRQQIRGTGFGLYIAKKIVDAHGGRIWAESEGENKGSTFNVELPLIRGKQPAVGNQAGDKKTA